MRGEHEETGSEESRQGGRNEKDAKGKKEIPKGKGEG